MLPTINNPILNNITLPCWTPPSTLLNLLNILQSHFPNRAIYPSFSHNTFYSVLSNGLFSPPISFDPQYLTTLRNMKENRLGDSRHDKPPRQISVPLQYHREKQQYHRFQLLRLDSRLFIIHDWHQSRFPPWVCTNSTHHIFICWTSNN
jgi:hypothetical protein